MSLEEKGANFAKLAATSQHIGTTGTAINGQLADLKTFLRPMVATWDGSAATNYKMLQDKWDASADSLNLVLMRLGVALDSANQGMQATEAANAGRFPV